MLAVGRVAACGAPREAGTTERAPMELLELGLGGEGLCVVQDIVFDYTV